jgi:hypothetical protein
MIRRAANGFNGWFADIATGLRRARTDCSYIAAIGSSKILSRIYDLHLPLNIHRRPWAIRRYFELRSSLLISCQLDINRFCRSSIRI